MSPIGESSAGRPRVNRREGDFAALLPRIYRELHRLAEVYMQRERMDHTLQATALINEVYLRIADRGDVDCTNRAQFLSVAAHAMRCLLVDHAKRRLRQKRGGGRRALLLRETLVASGEAWLDQADLLALNEALERLKQINADHARIVELRFFGGLTIPEAADVLSVSPSSVERGWRTARAWLYRELVGDDRAAEEQKDDGG